MNAQKAFAWFTTEHGKRFVFGGVCCLAIGIPSTNFLSHTFLLNKYKEIVQMYGLGVGVPLSARVTKYIQDVMDDMQLPDKKRKLIKPFTVYGFDMFHAGCTHTTRGAIIGIPSNFGYESTLDVDRTNVLVNLDQVSWGSEAGKNLLQAMVLSEEARKFAIGREIAYAQTPYVYTDSIFPPLVITSMYAFTTNCNKRLDFFKRPFALRAILYTLIGLFGFGSWAFMKDFTTVYYENQVDKEMCALGESYIKGGIEFYSKLLNRNIALRKLMGKKGEKLYTVTGNDQYMLRQLHMPLTLRKEYCVSQLEKLAKQHATSATERTSADASTPAPA
ncbi:hypothetical protein Cfor_10320 [Coptotermes formosanus]|uniref:Transmembrane protein 177 n=1 Tax=Coptotermes formosanus TaxID=36987 RepID=A0A6L2PSZ0_COPFO|nr:hypothetical protein Cfor_10320 [Coptotermes formosanus]